MALTPSTMLALGTHAPDFELRDTITGRQYSLSENQGLNGSMVMFICNHCPYVKHVQQELVQLATDFSVQGIEMVAISSNDVESYPEDGPDYMLEEARKWKYPFPYLFDETQEVARAYDAACTPDFFLFDNKMNLVYRGRIDGSTPGNGVEINGNDLRKAMKALIAGMPIDKEQLPSVGCNIKWK